MYSTPHFTYVVWWLHCLVVKLSIPGAQVGEHVGGDGQPEVGDAGASAAGDGGRRLGLQFLILTHMWNFDDPPLDSRIYVSWDCQFAQRPM